MTISVNWLYIINLSKREMQDPTSSHPIHDISRVRVSKINVFWLGVFIRRKN